MLTRRAIFFFTLVVICLALAPVTPSDFRAVPLAAAGLALFWGIMVTLEEISISRSRGGPRSPTPPAFAPPPPPGNGPDRSERS
jgi:hypothetical protein